MTKIFEGSEEELKNNVFPMDKLNEALKNLPDYKYFIGIDVASSDKSESAYCLVRVKNDVVVEVIKTESLKNRRKIKRHVRWLIEIFNAKINRE